MKKILFLLLSVILFNNAMAVNSWAPEDGIGGVNNIFEVGIVFAILLFLFLLSRPFKKAKN